MVYLEIRPWKIGLFSFYFLRGKKDERIISTGYNGTAPHQQHCCEIFNDDLKDHHEWSLNNEIHAEQNVISFCAKNGISTNGCQMFITLSPCIHCAKLIVAAGIKEIYFTEPYTENQGIKFLISNNVKVFTQNDRN